MATISKCDLCGEIFEGQGVFKGISIPTGFDIVSGERRAKYDCCPTCMKDISLTIYRLSKKSEKEKKPKIIAVDFDGTLCTNKYPEIGEPKAEIIKYIKQQKEQGAKIILWTCRSGDLLENALDWCRKHDVALDCVNENLPEIIEDFGSDTRKIFANEYIDDRNFFPSEDKEVIEDECC